MYVDLANQSCWSEFNLDETLDPVPNDRVTGITAAGILCRNGDAGGLRRLVKFVEIGALQGSPARNIDLNKGRGTSSPLLLAAAYGHSECVRVLLSTNLVNVNSARRDGVSSLTIACQQGHLDVVKLLCACPRLQVNKRTLFPERVTPCLLAIRAGRVDMLRVLLAHPRFDLQENKYGGSKSGQSAVEVAEAFGKKEIAEILRTHSLDAQRSTMKGQGEGSAMRGSEERSTMKGQDDKSHGKELSQKEPFDVRSAILKLTQRVSALEAENGDLRRRLASMEEHLTGER